jgi:DNA-binding transcriptional LysR family regulator
MISPALEEALLSGEIDVGISGLSGKLWPELCYEVLYQDRVAVALPKGHPLEICADIPLAMLADEPFVMYSRLHKKQGFDHIIALCQQAGFSPQIVQEAATEQAVISLVTAGAGIAIVVNSLHTVRADEVTYRTLIDPAIEANFGTVWRQDNPSPVVMAFLQIAHDLVQVDVNGSEPPQNT